MPYLAVALTLTLAALLALLVPLRRRERLRRRLAALDDPARTEAPDGSRRPIGWHTLNDGGRKYL